MTAPRMRRINEVLREVIGAAIATELSDPRIGFVTVTSVETSPDLRSAKVHVSVLGDEDAREGALDGLRSSHGVTSLIEADHINDQSVSFPMTDGIAGVGGIGILFVRASVGWNDAEVIAELIQLGQLSRRLN